MTTLIEYPQLVLPVRLRDEAVFDSFYPGPNGAVVSHLRLIAEGPAETVVWIWGATGSGKTHLLQAACAAATGSAVYLPLSDHRMSDPSLFDGWEDTHLVCLDDVEQAVGNDALEHALFSLYERLNEHRGTLLVAAAGNPRNTGFTLPDLASRLSSGPVFELATLNDEQRLAALQLRAQRRGFTLPEETGWYLLRRQHRDMHFLFALLDSLDRHSLAAQRRLTVPFVRQVISTQFS